MAGVTYKCPSCGAYLAFDPESQQWKCPFCDSTFASSELSEKDTQSAQTSVYDGEQLVYRCPNCASEIVTDETTVATNCYYCHSPVVLEGKMTADMRPDSVLPFTISKQQAVSTFMKWVKSKRYVPSAFFNQQQVESMTGVYYPHFVTNCELTGVLEGEAQNSSVADAGRYIVTTTQHYHVYRKANIRFQNLMRPALSKANRKLSDGIHPFPLEETKPFEDAYLSGFLAERRDVEKESIMPGIEKELTGYVQPLLTNSLSGYQRHRVNASAQLNESESSYVLLPTWVLTYPNPKDKNDPYYYAMNGCTGEICGKLPFDRKKLSRTGLLIAAAVFLIGCVFSYFLF